MRRNFAALVLFLFLANALIIPADGRADGALSGAHGRDNSRATTLIYNVYDLQNMSLDLNGSYELANDIDANATTGWNGGAGFVPVGNSTNLFQGSLDGRNHTISGLFIDLSAANYVGLFGYAGKDSSVKNIGIIDINVTGRGYVGGLVGENMGTVNNTSAFGNVTGNDNNVGGLVGRISANSTVNNSYATGNVGGYSSVGGLVGNGIAGSLVVNSYSTGNVNGTDSVGGLAGSLTDCWLKNSYAAGNVSGNSSVGGLLGFNYLSGVIASYASGDVEGYACVGGLVGINSRLGSNVKYREEENNTYATGNVSGDHDVGGLVGCNYDYRNVVNNSYATGNVIGDHDVGGLVGWNDVSTVSNCFWDNGTSGQRASAGGTGETTAEMKTQSTFTGAGWDFNNTWFMIENVTYPVLQWQDFLHPIADAGIDRTVDEGTVVTFDGSESSDNFGIASYTWTFSDVDSNTLYGVGPTYNFTNPGVYDVDLVVTNVFGFWSIDTTTVTVIDIMPPVSDAGPDKNVDEGTLVNFNGSGSSDNVGIVNYSWTFTDRALVTLNGAQTKYQFDNPGIFVVTLKVKDARGNWATDTLNVTVKDVTPPSADAGPDRFVYQGTIVIFDGSRSKDNVGIVNYSWKFNDGAPVTFYGVRASYRFDNPGIFVITLKVTDVAGNCGTDVTTVTVHDMMSPVADAGPDQIIDEGTLVTFDGSASSDNVGIINHTWTFTDGAPVSLYGARPVYRFDNPGLFVVTLTVADAAGNRGTDTLTITVIGVTVPVIDVTAPIANAGPDRTIDEGTLIAFDGSGSSDNVGVVNFTWTFTDVGPVTLYGARPTYKFDNPGVFVVALEVMDAAGTRGSDTMTVTVKDITAPVADAGPDLSVDEGTMVAFNGSGSSDNVGVVNYSWAFEYGGGRVILYGVSPSFTFVVPGVYHVLLNVSDAAGLWREDALTLTIIDITPPVANAGRDIRVRAGSTVVFDGSLSTDNGVIEKYSWNFTYDGKARSLEGKNATFKFGKAGVYEIVLTVVDGAGNRGEDRVVITVEPSAKTEGGLPGLLWMPVLLIAVAGLAGYLVMRMRKALNGGPPESPDGPAR